MTGPPLVTEVVIASIREARARDGWNARTLAEACAAAGMPSLDQSTITNILNNRRQRIGVDEWLTLAYVLNLPPTQMLLPLKTSDRARLTPMVTVNHDAALRWLLGMAPPPEPDDPDDFPKDAAEWQRNGAPTLRWRGLWRITDEIWDLLAERSTAAGRPPPEEGEFLQIVLEMRQRELDGIDQRLRGALENLTAQYDWMHEHHLSPPACPAPLLDEMDRLGVPRPKGKAQ